jgi:NADH-quinone oxidoreductase subunit J
MFEAIAFYLFSGLTIAMFAITVMTKNVLYSMSALAAGMIFISAFFFLVNADFLGVVQIVVYTGAVMALYAFGMMFFDTARDVKEDTVSPRMVFVWSGLIALVVVLFFTVPISLNSVNPSLPNEFPDAGNTQVIGYYLFTKYLVAFEVAAVMLLLAMIAGIVLAGKKMDNSITLMSEEEAQKHIAEKIEEINSIKSIQKDNK